MTHALEDQLHYPLGETLPTPGAAVAVAPGVHWARLGLPFALDHINVWLLRDCVDGREGWTVIDCGIDDAASRGSWERLFVDTLEGLPVLRVVVTHMHPDHVGLADWLTRRWQCRLWMSATDWAAAVLASSGSDDGGAGERLASTNGITDERLLAQARRHGGHYGELVPKVPGQFRRLVDAQVLEIGGRRWQCVAGQGHAPEHISLYCAALGVMVSGDMVLPRISTNVSVTEHEPEGDPLALYLQSLDRLRPLPDDTLVLPSHGRPFQGLQTRIGQLKAHHADRLAAVRAHCAERPRSAAETMPVLFNRPLDLQQSTFALGEAIAHLHALWQAGTLRRRQDPDGVWRFLAS